MKRRVGRVAIATGGGNGIGRGCAMRFAEEGATVALIDREAAALDATTAAICGQGGKVTTGGRGLHRRSAAAAFVDVVARDYGRIDILLRRRSEITASGRGPLGDGIIPFGIECVALEIECCHLCVGDLDFLWVSAGIQFAVKGCNAKGVTAEACLTTSESELLGCEAYGIAEFGRPEKGQTWSFTACPARVFVGRRGQTPTP
jgi:NAD(P)-dependent dehydrogenase (short-subunit alcohol dehydrogenase family)